MPRNIGDFSSGAGQPSAAPEAPSVKLNSTEAAPAAPAEPMDVPKGPLQIENAKPPVRKGGLDFHPDNPNQPLPNEKWHPKWAGVKGYQEPSVINGNGIKQIGKLRIIPKQKGSAYIHPRDLGDRPGLPHKEVDYDGSQVSLTPEQKKDNDLARESASNWDAHMRVANAHSEARDHISRQLALAAAAQETERKSSNLSADEAIIPENLMFSGGGLREHLDSLRDIHAKVAHLAAHSIAHGRTATGLAVDAANRSQGIANRLNERKADGSLKHPQGSESREDLMSGLNRSDQESDNLKEFPLTHGRAMNHIATAKVHMDGADKALRSGRNEDAARLLGEATFAMNRVVKHLSAPTTQRVIRAHAGFVSPAHAADPVPATITSGDARATLDNISEEIGQRPSRQERVKDPNASIKFNYRGFIHTYSLDKAGEKKLKSHFGTQHENYFKFKDAQRKNRISRTSVSELGRDVGEEPVGAERVSGEGFRFSEISPGTPGPKVRTTQVRKPAAQPSSEEIEAGQARRPIPERGSTFPSDLQTHTKIAVAHALKDMKVPYETQQVLGQNGLSQVGEYLKKNHGKDLML